MSSSLERIKPLFVPYVKELDKVCNGCVDIDAQYGNELIDWRINYTLEIVHLRTSHGFDYTDKMCFSY